MNFKGACAINTPTAVNIARGGMAVVKVGCTTPFKSLVDVSMDLTAAKGTAGADALYVLAGERYILVHVYRTQNRFKYTVKDKNITVKRETLYFF